jgi:hypothetical protein
VSSLLICFTCRRLKGRGWWGSDRQRAVPQVCERGREGEGEKGREGGRRGRRGGKEGEGSGGGGRDGEGEGSMGTKRSLKVCAVEWKQKACAVQ